MRIFKFRAWDKKEKEMLSDKEMDYDLDFKIVDKVIMQFTGLKDKNGKEIYEGDIIHWWYDDKGRGFKAVVVYKIFEHKSDFDSSIFNVGFAIDFGKDESEDYRYSDLPCDINRCEVIGNIFEDKELLK